MKLDLRINYIYEVDLTCLLEDLRKMGKIERQALYGEHTNKLFPKSKRVVSIDELLNDNVKVNREKFKNCFMVICNDFFSTSHFGEYNVRRFKEKTGLNTDRFFQKVILSLSLMGYINDGGLKCNYSSGNHGYVYHVDYLKWKGFNDDFWNTEPDDESDIFEDDESSNNPIDDFQYSEYSGVEKDWLVEKQLKTIRSIKIDKDVFRFEMQRKDELLSDSNMKTWNSKELIHINILERLYHRSKSILGITIDGDDGRLYSAMTNMKSSWRTNGTLHINGEGFCEVDMSSLHPTLFGLYVKQEHPNMESQWLNHCLKGDFYEWVMDITHIGMYSVEHVIKELGGIINVYFWSGEDDRKGMKNKVNKHKELIEMIEKVKSEDPKVRLRPVVKQWIMELLFSRFNMKSTEQDGNTIYKHFCHNLCKYLRENEPDMYNKLVWFKSKENLIPKKKNPTKLTSRLPRILQVEEVKFIKRCLNELDCKLDYLYTVHDCIGCLISDGDKVKEVMEHVSQEMYGHKLNLKIEGEAYENQLWKLVS